MKKENIFQEQGSCETKFVTLDWQQHFCLLFHGGRSSIVITVINIVRTTKLSGK